MPILTPPSQGTPPLQQQSKALLILQIADSAFPIGGFAHSNGLEAALKWGHVTNPDDLERFAQDSLVQITRGSLPFVRDAHRGQAFEELDALCNAFLNSHVANRASRRQGRTLLNTAATVFELPDLEPLLALVRDRKLACHLAPVFGHFTRCLDLQEQESLQLFLFMTLRSLVSSAVRLSLVGPLRGQTIQHELGPYVEELVANFSAGKMASVFQTAPLIDLMQATHDRAYSRLFQS